MRECMEVGIGCDSVELQEVGSYVMYVVYKAEMRYRMAP